MNRFGWLVLLFAAPALAQPAPKQAPPPDDFEKDLDALFVKGGLTADQAASLGTKTSPAVHRKVAEVEASVAQLEQARLAQIPILSAKASYTRLSFLPPINFKANRDLELSRGWMGDRCSSEISDCWNAIASPFRWPTRLASLSLNKLVILSHACWGGSH